MINQRNVRYRQLLLDVVDDEVEEATEDVTAALTATLRHLVRQTEPITG